MKFSGVITNDRSDVHAKGQGQRSKVKGQGHSGHNPTKRFRGRNFLFEFTNDDEIMDEAWSSKEVPYCFSR